MSDPKYEDWFHEALSTGQVSAAHDQQFQLCWQASRRAALEEAAGHITRGIEGVKQNGWIDAANERLRCADAVRALAEGDKQ